MRSGWLAIALGIALVCSNVAWLYALVNAGVTADHQSNERRERERELATLRGIVKATWKPQTVEEAVEQLGVWFPEGVLSSMEGIVEINQVRIKFDDAGISSISSLADPL